MQMSVLPKNVTALWSDAKWALHYVNVPFHFRYLDLLRGVGRHARKIEVLFATPITELAFVDFSFRFF